MTLAASPVQRVDRIDPSTKRRTGNAWPSAIAPPHRLHGLHAAKGEESTHLPPFVFLWRRAAPVARRQGFSAEIATWNTSFHRHLELVMFIIPSRVYRSDAGFLAFCDCYKCHAHNMKSPPCADKNTAIRQCEELIRQHHAERHPAAA